MNIIKRVLRKLLCIIKAWMLNQNIDEGNGRFCVNDPFIKVKIFKEKGSKIILKNSLIIENAIIGNGVIQINLGRNSKLIIENEFSIGSGVKISLSKDSTLYIKGRLLESASGITANTLIMVHHNITIGYDFICAWDVFITDSDWHQIKGQIHQSNVVIGDHVWIANNCSILKGSIIGNGCIVASHSKVINTSFTNKTLIGGVPAKVLKEEVEWSRDI